jgi:hypothetical protein
MKAFSKEPEGLGMLEIEREHAPSIEIEPRSDRPIRCGQQRNPI